MKSCAIIPTVTNQNGEIQESKFFKDLLTVFPRKGAVNVYLKTKTDEFKQKFNNKVKMDELGEPILSSLLKNTNAKDIIGEEKLKEIILKNMGKTKGKITRETYEELYNIANNFNHFNALNDMYIAEVKQINNNLQIFLTPKNAENLAKLRNSEYAHNLNKRIRELLNSWGIKVGSLNSFEEGLGINGVTDFSKVQSTAEGLIELIRIAKGERGEKALPEEFAHFAIEAMGDNPLKQRLLNMFIQHPELIQQLLGEEYQQYVEAYQGNIEDLVKEALGKAVAKALLQEQPINIPQKNLFQRFIDAIKKFFGKFNEQDINKIIIESNEQIQQLSSNVLIGNTEIKLSNIHTSKQFYNLQEQVNKSKEVYKKMIDTESKRYLIYKNRNPNSTFSTTQAAKLQQMQKYLAEGNISLGISEYLAEALDITRNLETRLTKINELNDIEEKATLLRNVKNYLSSYQTVTTMLLEVLREEQRTGEITIDENLITQVDQLNVILSHLFNDYRSIAMPLFVEFLKPFMGEQMVVTFGKYKGRVYTPEQIIQLAHEDITFFDRWLDSMADSGNMLLKIYDHATKKAKNNARLSTIHIRKQIEAAGRKAELAGIKDFKFMYQRDENGNLTGKYIEEYDYDRFKRDQREFFRSVNERYGISPTGQQAREKSREIARWFAEHTNGERGKAARPSAAYRNPAYDNMTTAQKEFYDTFRRLKEELDSLLPDGYTNFANIIMIRKDLLERIKSGKNVAKEIWEAIKDSYMRRSDDTIFGIKNTVIDFEGHKVESLPIYYTKLGRDEDINDVSTDAVSTLIAYASMATEYNELNKIVNTLELGRDLARGMNVQETQSGNVLTQQFEVFGRRIEQVLTKRGSQSRILDRLDDFFSMQIYGKLERDAGTFGKSKVDKQKAATLLNRLVSMCNTAFSITLGVSNVATGTIMLNTEAASGQYFNKRELAKAEKIYWQYLTGKLGEIGSRIKTNKLDLWNELFDVQQDYDQSIKRTNFDRKSLVSKIFGDKAMYFLTQGGEHYLDTKTSLALAMRYKMKDSRGNVVSLWDALDVRYIDANNPKLGAELVVKEGYTKLDGTEFTSTDLFEFGRRSAYVVQHMNGIYNQQDKNAAQATVVGKLAMIYRNWIKPSLNKRFKQSAYNFDAQNWTEGYYLSLGRFVKQLYLDLRQGQLNMATHWHELTNEEKYNIKRSLAELLQFAAICLVINLLDLGDDEDEDRAWFVAFAEYQLRRLRTEVGSLIPGPTMITEGLKILKSPAAGIQIAEKGISIVNSLFSPSDWFDEVQSGRFKGDVKLVANLKKFIPFYDTINKTINIEDQIAWYKQ